MFTKLCGVSRCILGSLTAQNSFATGLCSFTSISTSFQKAITPQVSHLLANQGYAVVDNVFGDSTAACLRAEVKGLHGAGRMHKNCTHLVKDNTTRLVEKARIHEAELTLDSSVQAAAPLCSSLNSDRSLATLLSLFNPQLTLDSQAIKLQYNEGAGGCFPMHFDSDQHLDGRRVTAIFYLNPGWSSAHGGQLRLYPWPLPPVDVEPAHDRLVLFSSTRTCHRVLPCHAERICFTIWLSQTRRRPSAQQQPLSSLRPATPAGDDLAADARFLMHPDVHKHVCKLVYAEEWATSIAESHPDHPDTQAMIQQHWKEVALIQKALGPYLPLIQRLSSDTLAAQSVATQLSWL